MGESIEVQVLWGDCIAFTSVRPCFVIANGAFRDGAATTRWSFDVATATKTCLASCIAEIGSGAAESSLC